MRVLTEAGRALSQNGIAEAGIADASNIDAARVVLVRAESLLLGGQSFAVETTLSGKTYIKIARRAKALGFNIHFFFVGTSSISINIERVRERVSRGGHDVPLADQLRRYPRSFAHMRELFTIADRVMLYDNSETPGYVKIAVKVPDKLALFEPLPEWASFLREL